MKTDTEAHAERIIHELEEEVQRLRAQVADQEVQPVEYEADPFLIESPVIRSQEEADQVVKNAQAAKELLEKISETYDKRIAQANEIHKGLLADRKAAAEPLDRFLDWAKGALGSWEQEKENRAHKERAEAEQLRLKEAAKIERGLLKSGMGADEARMRAEDLATAKVPAAESYARTAGVTSIRPGKTTVELVDAQALVKAIADPKSPESGALIKLDASAARAFYKALKRAPAGVKITTERRATI